MKSCAKDEDLVRAPRAMQLAAQDARRIAYLTRTPLVIYEDGNIVKKWISKEDLER